MKTELRTFIKAALGSPDLPPGAFYPYWGLGVALCLYAGGVLCAADSICTLVSTDLANASDLKKAGVSLIFGSVMGATGAACQYGSKGYAWLVNKTHERLGLWKPPVKTP